MNLPFLISFKVVSAKGLCEQKAGIVVHMIFNNLFPLHILAFSL
jgi:hypothetical protein